MRPSGWTAVVTAAGNATRFRPFSTNIPKEMLPVGHRPAVEHVITECVHAGATTVIVATRPGDLIVPSYLDVLRRDGVPVEAVTEDLGHGYGNGTPLLTLRDRLASQESFGVAFGDNVLLGGHDLAAMRAIASNGADAVIAAQRVDPADISSFGVVDTHPDDPGRVTGIRQRPDPATVSTPLALVSRLILGPSIFDLLIPTERARGEVDLGIAVGELARIAEVRVHHITGRWVTVGEPRRYFDALCTYWLLQSDPTPPLLRTTVTLIDIFNDRYEPVGTEDKKTAHAQGLWHRTFSALAINPTTRRVILQKKAPGRYSFERPDYADFTVGGHYQAGETIPEGVREVHEELGLPITYHDLHPLGLRQTAVTLAPDYIEREFQHWHLLPLDVALEEIPLADAEVSGLVDIDLHDALGLADGDRGVVTARYATRTDTGLSYSEATLTRAELVPNYLRLDQLYLRLFVAARRFCAGERRHVFW